MTDSRQKLQRRKREKKWKQQPKIRLLNGVSARRIGSRSKITVSRLLRLLYLHYVLLTIINEAIEDFRTALQRVHKFLVDLDLLTHSRTRRSFNIAGRSTSSTELVTAELLENDGRRVEIMNRIIGILERNLRVRYELKISDVLKS